MDGLREAVKGNRAPSAAVSPHAIQIQKVIRGHFGRRRANVMREIRRIEIEEAEIEVLPTNSELVEADTRAEKNLAARTEEYCSRKGALSSTATDDMAWL